MVWKASELPGLAAKAHNPSCLGDQAGRLQVQGQPRQFRETLCQDRPGDVSMAEPLPSMCEASHLIPRTEKGNFFMMPGYCSLCGLNLRTLNFPTTDLISNIHIW